MSDERWIVIPRWDEFQHPDAGRSRTLPWIKSYTRLLSDDNYLSLTAHQRAILHGLWLEYARSGRQLRLTTGSLSARLSLRVMTRDIEALNHAGFIELSASKPASQPASNPASLDKRRERTPLPPTGKPPQHNCVHCHGGQQFKTEQRLTEHLANAHGIEEGRPQ